VIALCIEPILKPVIFEIEIALISALLVSYAWTEPVVRVPFLLTADFLGISP